MEDCFVVAKSGRLAASYECTMSGLTPGYAGPSTSSTFLISSSVLRIKSLSSRAAILAVHQLPATHRKRMRSTNMLERVNQEIKRRTRVIHIFPNEQACVHLVSTLTMEVNQEWMERLYLRMDEVTETESTYAVDQRPS